ncbi:MAG: hypothetical protein DHS20C05_01960 [Hyphococcus sp.]|nr:MAG: hypothetical protein DHS20C05_01960 [Marinicaulis sp.]
MRFLFTCVFILAAFGPQTAVALEDVLATSVHQISPPYPESCMPEAGEQISPQSVTISFDVTKNGEPRNVRAQSSTNSCFEEVSVAAVRAWEYSPRRVNGKRKAQESLEATFTYVLNKPTLTEVFDARPRVRVPPIYPRRCSVKEEDGDSVLVEFDVSPEGETENVRVIKSTNSCFEKASAEAVKEWSYSPKTIAGEPVARRGVQTTIRFLGGSWPMRDDIIRPTVQKRLARVQRQLSRNPNPEKAIAELAALEEKYGHNFTDAELNTFHFYRSYARMGVKDYAGALDDLRIVMKTNPPREYVEPAQESIYQLEKVIAAQAAEATRELQGAEAIPPAE